MPRYVFWNRRSGADRRQIEYLERSSDTQKDGRRQGIDRRLTPNNDYLLIIGDRGLDAFELLIIVPLVTVLSATVVGSFVGGI